MSPDPLYYRYDAAEHCTSCAGDRFQPATDGDGRRLPYLTGTDSEGNPITPVYDWDDSDSDHDFARGPRLVPCSTCHFLIVAVISPGGVLIVNPSCTLDELVAQWQEHRDQAEQDAADEAAGDTDWPVIHAYTRAQALADGSLVAVPEETSKEAGFKPPVALTAAVEAKLRSIPDRFCGEDYNGRLWDVLHMAALTARSPRNRNEQTIAFQVLIHDSDEAPRDDSQSSPHLHELYLTIGPGDTPEPVLTIQTALDL